MITDFKQPANLVEVLKTEEFIKWSNVPIYYMFSTYVMILHTLEYGYFLFYGALSLDFASI